MVYRLASVLEVAGAEYPREFEGNSITPLVGKSFISALKKNTPIHREPIFWEHEGNKAVRHGRYKLVSKWNRKNETTWELYDMDQDRTEMNDLSEKFPEKVVEMKAMYDDWAQKTKVLPRSVIDSLMTLKKQSKS